MGLATAKIVGRDHTVVLSDVTSDRLQHAAAALTGLGMTPPTIVNCDVTDRDAVGESFEIASDLGRVASVIHTTGVSPCMGDADYVTGTNALGTVHVNEAFLAPRPMDQRSSTSPRWHHTWCPTTLFFRAIPLALSDEAAFTGAMNSVFDAVPEEARFGYALHAGEGLPAWKFGECRGTS